MPTIDYSRAELMDKLVANSNQITVLSQQLTAYSQQEKNMAATLQELIASLTAKVTENASDTASVKAAIVRIVAVLDGISAQNAAFKAQIADLISKGVTPEQLLALQAMETTLVANDADLDAAVASANAAADANTPPSA